jgi:hypothetical protein
MSDEATQKGAGHMSPQLRMDTMAEAILESPATKEPNLEQVREILFGAETRRAEAARSALEGRTTERFARLEAEYERRFEKLLSDMQQRFEGVAAMLEAESIERRNSLQKQHEQLTERIQSAVQSLKESKTNRDELAGLLEDLASRLRSATA